MRFLLFIWLLSCAALADDYRPGYWAGDVFGPDLKRLLLLNQDVQISLEPVVRRDYSMQHAALRATYHIQGEGEVTVFVPANGFHWDHRNPAAGLKPALKLDGKPVEHVEVKPPPQPPWKLPDRSEAWPGKSFALFREPWSVHSARLKLTPGVHVLQLEQNLQGTAVSADSPTQYWLFNYGFTPATAWRSAGETQLSLTIPQGWECRTNLGAGNSFRYPRPPTQTLVVAAHGPAPLVVPGPWGVITGGMGAFVLFIVLAPFLQASRATSTWYAALHAAVGAALGVVVFWSIGGADSSDILRLAGDQAAWSYQLPWSVVLSEAATVFAVSLAGFCVIFLFIMRQTILPAPRPFTLAHLLPALVVLGLCVVGVASLGGSTLWERVRDLSSGRRQASTAAQGSLSSITVDHTYTSRNGKNGPVVAHTVYECRARFEAEGKPREAVSYSENPGTVGEAVTVNFPQGHPERGVIQGMEPYRSDLFGLMCLLAMGALPLGWMLLVTLLDRVLRLTPLTRLFLPPPVSESQRRY